jgi:protein involved in polysaccharide export with SLBB domain
MYIRPMAKFNDSHFVIIFFTVFFISANITAQTEESGSDEAAGLLEQINIEQSQTINPDALIHFGDLIDVDVLGSTEYDWRGTITPEGFLDGIEFTEDSIYGLCRTEQMVAADIAASYGRFLNNPNVKVTILDRSNRPVSTLFGAVRLPQRFKIRRPVYLNELIVLAGGFTDRASGEIQILRQPDASCAAKLANEKLSFTSNGEQRDRIVNSSQDNSSEFINLTISDLLSGKNESNPQILYGDVVTIRKAEPVYIIGGVVNPRQIPIRDRMTVSRAIATAGGLTKQANRQKIIVFRRVAGQTKIIEVNLNDIESQNTVDLLLQAYDIVDVAEDDRNEKKYPPVLRIDEPETEKMSELPIRIID